MGLPRFVDMDKCGRPPCDLSVWLGPPRWQNSLLGVEWSIAVEMAAYALFPFWHRLALRHARWLRRARV